MADQQQLKERRQYVTAWNNTMIRIWREKIVMLGVIDTGALYRSVVAVETRMDGRVVSIALSQSFNTYGIFQDRGTGREVPIGNPGDIGRDKQRQRRKWFSTKYYASFMNLKEFLADNLGRSFLGMMSNVFDNRAFDQSLRT